MIWIDKTLDMYNQGHRICCFSLRSNSVSHSLRAPLYEKCVFIYRYEFVLKKRRTLVYSDKSCDTHTSPCVQATNTSIPVRVGETGGLIWLISLVSRISTPPIIKILEHSELLKFVVLPTLRTLSPNILHRHNFIHIAFCYIKHNAGRLLSEQS